MQARTRAITSIAITTLIVGATVGSLYLAFTSPLQTQRFLVRLVVISLIIFLAILLLRYFALLWFGFLQHAEKTVRGSEGNGELPPVSIIVPAYNEGKVLDDAIEALVELDYPTYEVIIP